MDQMKQSGNLGRQRNLAGVEFYLSDRDNQILHFLWRWKLAPTATIHEAVGRPNTPYSTYKAMERLAKHHFVESVVNRSHRFTSWQLTENGFDTIREDLGDLKEEGYLSENHWHDLNVLAFHLGEWSSHAFPQVQLFTEQDLRRRSVEYYPDWVPKIGTHRADGYTRIAANAKPWVLAFEVELWAKSVAIYESVIRYYRMYRALDRVYWLIGRPDVKDQILRAKVCVHDEQDNYHLFVDLPDYQRLGWDAPVRNARSETLFTMRENMRGMLGDPYSEYVGNMRGNFTVPIHYDPNKVLGKSRP